MCDDSEGTEGGGYIIYYTIYIGVPANNLFHILMHCMLQLYIKTEHICLSLLNCDSYVSLQYKSDSYHICT